MAYSDYGAFVYKDGMRREDKEDVGVFDTDEANLPSGLRIWANIIKNINEDDVPWWKHSQHGVMGDGAVRVSCYKQGFPRFYVAYGDEVSEIESDTIIKHNGWGDSDFVSSYDGKLYVDYGYPWLDFKVPGLEGYSFSVKSGRPYVAIMKEPDGTFWECEYDYGYGAGFESDL